MLPSTSPSPGSNAGWTEAPALVWRQGGVDELITQACQPQLRILLPLGVAAQFCNTSTWEVEAGVQDI